ncbi:MAG: YhcH/YjgK/YiaL family protein [Firmicutes bacterium]|nr:YhcH/YjgK/YiaL family protein [Bacillota bacterium]
MIYGNVNNRFFAEQAAMLPEALRAALHYLKDTDLAAHEPGKFDVTIAGVPMILQVIDQKTAQRDQLRPEIHRKNIDVQFLAAGGPEEAGYYSDDGSNVTDEDLLDTPRDILFYHNNPAAPEGRIRLRVGSFAVYFPWDVHIPAICEGAEPADIRKIVLKVPMSACLKDWKFQ